MPFGKTPALMTVLDAKEDSRQVEIRQERPEERRAVETLVRNAFWNQYAPGCMEHYLLHVLRSHKDFVPPLNLVAELEGKPVGQCACVKGKLWGDDGAVCTVLTLGPIAVRPDFQNRGSGKCCWPAPPRPPKSWGTRPFS